MKIININMDLSSSEIGEGPRYLVLDHVPNLQWNTVFRHLHKQLMDSGKRAVELSGKNIIVNSAMDEIQYQIDTLNALCQQTDDQIVAAHEESQRREQERVRLAEEKRKAAREEYGKLKF